MRKIVLADSAQRIQAYQVEALHREKLVSLGTLAAGLMHELHNPGSAAKRAASQLRENLLRLQQLSLRNSGKPKTPAQIECMRSLLEHALHGCQPAGHEQHRAGRRRGSHERMARRRREWRMHSPSARCWSPWASIATILPAREEHFDAAAFSDALNWFGALVSSVSLVCAIEESISRISELVMAVKNFAYDERTPGKELDVHDSLQSTLTILGHKIRLKQISGRKALRGLALHHSYPRSALSQVWTNLIDNAIDASPEGAKIEIATWSEPELLAVCIGDHGAGIPPELLPHIFEPFFTTKPQGSGTGLGLEIVHRIVTQKFGGTIRSNRSRETRDSSCVCRRTALSHRLQTTAGSR